MIQQIKKCFSHIKIQSYQIHIADVGLVIIGVKSSNDWLNEVGSKAPLVQQVGEHCGECLGFHNSVLF